MALHTQAAAGQNTLAMARSTQLAAANLATAKANLTTANPGGGKKHTSGRGRQQSTAIPAAARSTQPAAGKANLLAAAQQAHGAAHSKTRTIDGVHTWHCWATLHPPGRTRMYWPAAPSHVSPADVLFPHRSLQSLASCAESSSGVEDHGGRNRR
jgi:hypothetical protein